mgnify:CR=1 FL=1
MIELSEKDVNTINNNLLLLKLFLYDCCFLLKNHRGNPVASVIPGNTI